MPSIFTPPNQPATAFNPFPVGVAGARTTPLAPTAPPKTAPPAKTQPISVPGTGAKTPGTTSLKKQAMVLMLRGHLSKMAAESEGKSQAAGAEVSVRKGGKPVKGKELETEKKATLKNIIKIAAAHRCLNRIDGYLWSNNKEAKARFMDTDFFKAAMGACCLKKAKAKKLIKKAASPLPAAYSGAARTAEEIMQAALARGRAAQAATAAETAIGGSKAVSPISEALGGFNPETAAGTNEGAGGLGRVSEKFGRGGADNVGGTGGAGGNDPGFWNTMKGNLGFSGNSFAARHPYAAAGLGYAGLMAAPGLMSGISNAANLGVNRLFYPYGMGYNNMYMDPSDHDLYRVIAGEQMRSGKLSQQLQAIRGAYAPTPNPYGQSGAYNLGMNMGQ